MYVRDGSSIYVLYIVQCRSFKTEEEKNLSLSPVFRTFEAVVLKVYDILYLCTYSYCKNIIGT